MSLPRIIFIRHGETDYNAEARLQGQRNIPLNARGLVQAEQAGKSLLNLVGPAALAGPDLHWISSPLERATQTMNIVRTAGSLPQGGYGLDERLKELSFGEWEGLTWPEVKGRAPHAAGWREGDKWNFVPPGGESYQMLSDRVWPWVNELDRETVVTAHGGVARVLLAELAGMDRQRAALENIWQGRLLIFEKGSWKWVGAQ